MKIGLDTMGGDFAPQKTIHGAILASKELQNNVKIVLFGKKTDIINELNSHNFPVNNFDIVDCSEKIEMGEHAVKALKNKPNSSIAAGFKYLSNGKINGFASAGNTGAMFAGGFFTVKAISGVLRPCISTFIPKENGQVGILLDVGANADCKPDVLYQFGVLGSLFAKHVCGISNPKVGLLNIGKEKTKGNMLTQSTFPIMEGTNDYNFIGNIESRDIFSDESDVIVCDGFTGNIILKEMEAFYTLIKKRGYEDEYFKRFNYENYGGTPILGLSKTVIIGHGISNEIAIKNMIKLTKDVVEADLGTKIKETIQ